MTIDGLLAALENRKVVTRVTPCNPIGIAVKLAWLLGCTLVTPVTPYASYRGEIHGTVGSESVRRNCRPAHAHHAVILQATRGRRRE